MNDGDAFAGLLLKDLVLRFGGTLDGDGDRLISALATLAEANAGALSFLANPRYRGALATTRAAAVLLSPAAAAQAAPTRPADGPAFWIATDPYLTFARVAQHYYAASAPRFAPGIAPSAMVDPAAQVDPSAHIGPHVIVGARTEIGPRSVIGAASIIGADVSIGADALFHPRVTIYARCVIGARAIFHSGVVIGADGFGFARDGHVWVKIPQTGRVVIGDDVEIGANTTIDRGALEDTVVGDGVKMDNQIQIGHNVKIGNHTAMAGCSAVAGSTTIGARCQIGGAAMILGHLELGDDVAISVGTVISRSMLKPGLYTGFFPVSENARWEKNAALVRHLEALRDRVRALEQQIGKDQGLA